MAYTFDVVAWEGWDGRRHGGTPRFPEDARSMKVLVTNPGNSGDTHQFWAHSTIHFQDFAEWWTYIGGLMVMHGMELEDEPPDFDDDFGGPGEEPPEEPPPPPPPPRKPFRARVARIIRRMGKWFR